MAGKVVPAPPAAPFEYELVEDDERMRTVVATSSQSPFWIDPASLRLRHRIGRGPFGDVFIATHHQSTGDYDEYHEVAVKMLHPVKDDYITVLLNQFELLFSKCQGSEGVCLFHGVSVVRGKVCIVMKFYEGSVADKMAQLKGGKLSLSETLTYGVQLAEAISKLHEKEILLLNLKCSNILLNESDQAIVGDIGIPFVLLDAPLPSADMSRRLGTPNYMAPEQWQPETRGPVSFESDSWGFGCSVVEMLTGCQPWYGKSAEEIFDLVVIKQEKPRSPEGLPPPVEKIVMGCFEYDLRNRPLMTDIIRVFQSSQNAVNSDVSWIGLESITFTEKATGSCTEWFLLKDRLLVGDTVRSRKAPNSRNPDNMEVPEGMVVGLDHDSERDGFVLVKVHGLHDPLRIHTSSLERVSFGLAAGDWVRLKDADKKISPVGILHSISRKGDVSIGVIGSETLWKGHCKDLQMAEPFYVDQFVKLKANVVSPQFGWPRKGTAWAAGRVTYILSNGCLVVKFPGRLSIFKENSSYLADPSQVEAVSFNTCKGVVKKYQHLEDFHWAIRPLLITIGIFTAMKMGIRIGKKFGRSKVKKQHSRSTISDGSQTDSHAIGASSNPTWFPPSVANILGVAPAQ